MIKRTRRRGGDQAGPEWTALDDLLRPVDPGGPAESVVAVPDVAPEEPSATEPASPEPASPEARTQPSMAEDEIETWDQAAEYVEGLIAGLVADAVRGADELRSAARRTASRDAGAAARRHLDRAQARADGDADNVRAAALVKFVEVLGAGALLRAEMAEVAAHLADVIVDLRARHGDFEDALAEVRVGVTASPDQRAWSR